MNPFQIAGSGRADWRAAAQSFVATAIPGARYELTRRPFLAFPFEF